MSIKFDEAWMLATVLLWVRLGALFFMSPFVSAARMPAVVVVVFTLVLAGMFTLAFEVRAAQSLAQMGPLALAVLSELLTGALMHLFVKVVGLPYLPMQVVTTLIVMIFTFGGHKFFSFADRAG